MSGQPGKLAGLLSPVFLRVVLGVTFIWAGLGKLIPSVPVQGVDAALLSNAGLSLDPGRRRPPQPAEDEAPAPQLDPPQPLPLPAPGDAAPQSERRNRPRPIPSPDDEYATGLAAVPAVEIEMQPLASLAREPAPSGRGKAQQPKANGKKAKASSQPPPSILDQPAEPAEASPPAAPPSKPAATPSSKPSNKGASRSQAGTADKSAAWPKHLPVGRATAKDYPNPVEVQRVNEVALLLIKSAFPAPLDNGKARMSIWPQRLALDPWPRYMAWAAALTELFCGAMLLVGFFTRTNAVILCLTTANAIWLTTIGPAIASENAVLGILPDRTWWAPKEWATPLWQMAIVAMCLSVAFAGAGWLSLDRFFAAAGGKKKADEEDEE